MATATVSWGPPAAHFGKEVPALQSSARQFQQHASPAPVGQREGPKESKDLLRATRHPMNVPLQEKGQEQGKEGAHSALALEFSLPQTR